mmetsp:Transcript_76837/g.124314  ORF Transcript_76837/g.124314 Transcript_76837/m.124314 type:complete len:160 (-) Transcript_76837:55-534(-)
MKSFQIIVVSLFLMCLAAAPANGFPATPTEECLSSSSSSSVACEHDQAILLQTTTSDHRVGVLQVSADLGDRMKSKNTAPRWTNIFKTEGQICVCKRGAPNHNHYHHKHLHGRKRLHGHKCWHGGCPAHFYCHQTHYNARRGRCKKIRRPYFKNVAKVV